MTDIDETKYTELCKLRSGKYFLLLIFKLVAFIASYVIVVSGWDLFNVYRVSEWQLVNATVIHNETKELPDKGMTYIDFQYIYEISDKKYTSTQVGHYPIWVGKHGTLKKIRGLKEKDNITVFIDPNRHDFVYFDIDMSAYRLQFYMLCLYVFMIFMFDAWVGGASILKLKKEMKELVNDKALD